MTLIPLTEVASLLAIDAKTLRQWLKHTDLSLQAHPTDKRIKCLTNEQVLQLATLHGRPMMSNPVSVEAPPSPSGSFAQPQTALQLQPTSAFPSASDSDLINRLCSLESDVRTLQQQVTQLALELLRERTIEQHKSTNASQIPPSSSNPRATEAVGASPQKRLSSQRWSLNPAELRARSRIIPLIEYGADCTYVIISPQDGELFLTPDSPDWFDWLASLSSFRFVGPLGRFSAYRASGGGQHTRCWAARRFFHGHDFWHYLGVTDRLTVALLEHAAALLQSRVDAL